MAEVFTISGAGVDILGAASAPVRELQNALKSLGNTVRDSTLMVLVVDGLIGPKTTAATNRAFTVHIGAGQAAAAWRTGSLSQTEVAANATTLAQMVIAEVNRRGGNIPAPAVAAVKSPTSYVPAAAPASAGTPMYLQPNAAVSSGMDPAVKWVLIGLGAVAVGAAAYLLLAGKRTQGASQAMAGHDPRKLNNQDREQWINNDEGLYRWMQSESRMGGGIRGFIKRNRAEIDAAILKVLDRKPADTEWRKQGSRYPGPGW